MHIYVEDLYTYVCIYNFPMNNNETGRLDWFSYLTLIGVINALPN